MNKREVVYMVTYRDDSNQKHLAFVKGFSAVRVLEERFGYIEAFVKGFSAVRVLEERFGYIEYEVTEQFVYNHNEVWY